ncbi:MAG: c-type cytochrome biogenesis protein CcmI [Devosia sp.]
MIVWIFVAVITATACAALYYAAGGRPVNATADGTDATTNHFRRQLDEIETDLGAGRLGQAESVAAKAELARELVRAQGDSAEPKKPAGNVLLPLVAIAALAVGTYWMLGKPELPASPLATRTDLGAPTLNLDVAIEAIEKRLAENPDDLRGWQVIAPAYMQLSRFADAAKAYRRVNELAPPTADSETDLGEALMMQKDGNAEGEPLALFKSAASRDPRHIRSRFYIASEETRAGNFEAAIADWNALLALAKGDEPWVVTARDGLTFAEQSLHPTAPTQPPDAAQIDAMVDGLEARLTSEGGTIEEWTQLVRSRMVQGRMDEAQKAYDAARKAYPDALMRIDLDVLAADSGLVAGPSQ